MSRAGTGGAARAELVVMAGAGTAIDDAYASDWWDPRLLGVDARRGDNRPRFDTIVQPWLREAAKSWCRFRLATGCAFGSVVVGASSLSRFSRFLHRRHPGVGGGPDLTRSVLVDYLSWLASSDWSITTRFMSLTTLRVFIDHCRRHGWLPGLAADAVIYEEELPRRTEAVPRFIPEFVMTQLESESALAMLATPTLRNLVVVLMETGLRSTGCLRARLRPHGRRQRRLAVPAVQQLQGADRTAHPVERQGSECHPGPAGPRPGQVAGGHAVAVPRTARQRGRLQALRPGQPQRATATVAGRH